MPKQLNCTKMCRYENNFFFALWVSLFVLLLFCVSGDDTSVGGDVYGKVKSTCLGISRYPVTKGGQLVKKLIENKKTLKNVLIGNHSLFPDSDLIRLLQRFPLLLSLPFFLSSYFWLGLLLTIAQIPPSLLFCSK